MPNVGHAQHENTLLSESETARERNWKVLSDGEAGARVHIKSLPSGQTR